MEEGGERRTWDMDSENWVSTIENKIAAQNRVNQCGQILPTLSEQSQITFKKYLLFQFLLCFLSPEQQKEAIDLQHHSDDGPANQHHKHTSQEETGGLHLVLLEEEAEGPLQPDDKGESSNKQDLQWKKHFTLPKHFTTLNG